MKGVILCGGLGTRLNPLTLVSNKHLLPVWNQPMVYYPIQSMVASGITDIMLVCGGNAAGEFLRIVGNGEQFGLKHVAYTYQHQPKGIADALGLAEEWVAGEPICVLLGDNILQNPFGEFVEEFEERGTGARIFLAETDHPERYGVVEVKGDKIISIEEKPKAPKSNLVAIGLYMYDTTVWTYIKSLKPSRRQELEITGLNNRYLKLHTLKYHKINGGWRDCGESIAGYNDSCVIARQWDNAQTSHRL